jgi:hypothetical protein
MPMRVILVLIQTGNNEHTAPHLMPTLLKKGGCTPRAACIKARVSIKNGDQPLPIPSNGHLEFPASVPNNQQGETKVKATTPILTAIAISLMATTAQADKAVKFSGDLVPDALRPRYARVVDKFFKDDARGREEFACFQGDLLSLHKGQKIGVGVDCLRIAVIDDTTSGDTTGGMPDFGMIANTIDASVAIDAVTFFFFPGGHLVSDGWTTVRPFFAGIGNGDGTPDEGSVSHLTGSIPGEAPTVVAASGRFSKLVNKGNVRLSGAVNLGLEGSLFFSCLFVIQDNLGHVPG